MYVVWKCVSVYVCVCWVCWRGHVCARPIHTQCGWSLNALPWCIYIIQQLLPPPTNSTSTGHRSYGLRGFPPKFPDPGGHSVCVYVCACVCLLCAWAIRFLFRLSCPRRTSQATIINTQPTHKGPPTPAILYMPAYKYMA